MMAVDRRHVAEPERSGTPHPPETGLPEPSLHVQTGDAARAGWRIRLAWTVLRLLFRALFRLRFEGFASAPRGQVVVCANHLGWAEAFLIVLFRPTEPRTYVLGEEAGVVTSPLRRLALDAFEGMVPLDRSEPLAAVRAMYDLLGRGGSLLLFPEGELGTVEGELQPLRSGAAHLSLRTGVPILPIGVTGTSRLWLRRAITLRVGPALHPAAVVGPSQHERAAAMTRQLDAALRHLLPGDDPPPRVRLLERWLTTLL
jgi:1-acyl-sn-glycerol-3-phosphate acyltransferase